PIDLARSLHDRGKDRQRLVAGAVRQTLARLPHLAGSPLLDSRRRDRVDPHLAELCDELASHRAVVAQRRRLAVAVFLYVAQPLVDRLAELHARARETRSAGLIEHIA